MQQRALIARALATEAELLVMDEPTAGVDHENQQVLAELLHGLGSTKALRFSSWHTSSGRCAS